MNLVTSVISKASAVNYENFTNRTSELLAKLMLVIAVPIFISIAVVNIYTHLATDILAFGQNCKINTPGKLHHCLLGLNRE